VTSSVNAVESRFCYWLTAKDLGFALDKHGSFSDLAMSVDSGPEYSEVQICPQNNPGYIRSASVMAVRASALLIKFTRGCAVSRKYVTFHSR